MDNTIDALNEVDQDTLAKLTLAAAAGLLAAAGGKKIYKKYKEHKILNKYHGQEDDKKHRDINPYMSSLEPGDIVDVAKNLINAKK